MQLYTSHEQDHLQGERRSKYHPMHSAKHTCTVSSTLQQHYIGIYQKRVLYQEYRMVDIIILLMNSVYFRFSDVCKHKVLDKSDCVSCFVIQM